jgi:hypothetical protein
VTGSTSTVVLPLDGSPLSERALAVLRLVDGAEPSSLEAAREYLAGAVARLRPADHGRRRDRPTQRRTT